MYCLYCAEQLVFVPFEGWVHADGHTYKTRTLPNGDQVDDHCATPTTDLTAAQQMKNQRETQHTHPIHPTTTPNPQRRNHESPR